MQDDPNRTPNIGLSHVSDVLDNNNLFRIDQAIGVLQRQLAGLIPGSSIDWSESPQTIPQSALQVGASLNRVQSSASTGATTINTTTTVLATTTISPPDDPLRWELLIGQSTVRFTAAATGLGNLGVLLNFHRGGAGGQDYQFRQVVYTRTAAAVGDLVEVPITLVFLTQPNGLLSSRWDLNAIVQTPSGAQVTAQSMFGQLHILQFT